MLPYWYPVQTLLEKWTEGKVKGTLHRFHNTAYATFETIHGPIHVALYTRAVSATVRAAAILLQGLEGVKVIAAKHFSPAMQDLASELEMGYVTYDGKHAHIEFPNKLIVFIEIKDKLNKDKKRRV